MKRVIGIVSEGPTDFMVLKAVIDKITGEQNRYLSLQPEPDLLGRYGNGWKGVWKWCKEIVPLEILMDELEPKMDFVVIQMDGDVVRKEKEIHCLCDATICLDKGKVFPLYCDKVVNNCPVHMPCSSHTDGIMGIINHGVSVLTDTLDGKVMDRVIITIPCDSTDAWVVAAYDDISNVENVENPWKEVIAKSKYYHGIRVRRDKKSTVAYAEFLDTVVGQWNEVTEKCLSAKELERKVKEKSRIDG